MASLQNRNGSYRVQFKWHGRRESFTIGPVSLTEAQAKASQVDYLLLRLKQGLLTLPSGVPIADFVEHDGNPPVLEPPKAEDTPQVANVTLGELRDEYLTTNEKSLEESSLTCIRIHFKHLTTALGEDFDIRALSLADLQGYVNGRTKADGLNGRKLSPATMRKEIVTLRTAWNWAVPMGYVSGRFPNKGLRFPKGAEKLPFMTYEEIQRRLDGTNDDIWECLYLRVPEISALLAHVKAKKAQPFVYPMVCFAAHTGARRSEIVRVKVADVDFVGKAVTLRERKRDHSRTTTRRVSLSPFLIRVLKNWLKVHPGGPHLFCQSPDVQRSKKKGRAVSPLTRDEFHDHFQRVLKGSKWEVLKGAHALRHSFISALASKGVDQRIIDDFVGHQSEEQRRRYRHLYPDVKQEALASVFG